MFNLKNNEINILPVDIIYGYINSWIYTYTNFEEGFYVIEFYGTIVVLNIFFLIFLCILAIYMLIYAYFSSHIYIYISLFLLLSLCIYGGEGHTNIDSF